MLFILILILTLISGFITPWWAMAIICFVMALYAGKKPAQAFWSGFGAVFIVWTVLALVKSIPNDHLLAARMAVVFNLPHWTLLLFVVSLVGGLVGGISALSGFLVRRIIIK